MGLRHGCSILAPGIQRAEHAATRTQCLCALSRVATGILIFFMSQAYLAASMDATGERVSAHAQGIRSVRCRSATWVSHAAVTTACEDGRQRVMQSRAACPALALLAAGVFAWAAARLTAASGGRPAALFAVYAGLSALITAAAGNDTSIMCLTPIIVYMSQSTGCDPMVRLRACVSRVCVQLVTWARGSVPVGGSVRVPAACMRILRMH
jgi:hypothetical protein